MHMARARTAKHPKPVEPEDEVQESPEEEPVAIIELTTPTVSKAEAVRIALSEGLESPGDIHDFIKARFGHDIPNQTISSYKAQEKARQAKKAEAVAPVAEPAKRGRKPKAATPLVEGYVAPPEKPKAAGEPDVLLALESVKELVNTYGADRVRRIVELLS
jgi:hypothetical protein